MDMVERIAIAETKLKGFDSKCAQLERESSTMEKLVTEHSIQLTQQQKWSDDHAKLHRDWNMKLWFILIMAVLGVIVPVVVKLA
ncbi:hypothetical protein LCGC14_1982800 [marine sediment metagenome]|uniref:Uncharacterized protein n=1 Tax=marine sediment metagenome TaxID=412755 RepID=A0A0F9I5G8_9ZZZZ